jgi:hypothetical protein
LDEGSWPDHDASLVRNRHDHGTMRQLSLQLELEARPITGSIEYEDGSHDYFAGWLGLLSILENAAAEPERRPAPPEPQRSRSSDRPRLG